MKHAAFRHADALALALLGGASLATFALWSRLPALVPTHFDLAGHVDQWRAKSTGATFLPAFGLGAWALVRLGSFLQPRDARARAEASPMHLVGVLVAALFAGLQLLVLWIALDPTRSPSRALGTGLGAFWLLFGLVVPRIRRNAFVGVRTPWSLASDENWARTHRLAGLSCTVGGAVAVVAAVCGVPVVALPCVLVSALIPAIGSWHLARKLPPGA